MPDHEKKFIAAGVSVIICCYNSAGRIYQTLKHLAGQQVPEGFLWEIILVNNASKDNTAAYAEEAWDTFQATGVELKIIDEHVPGQMHARKKGAREAKYEYLIFCDDDNWLDKSYVWLAEKMLKSDQQIGAGGGQNSPVTDAAEYPDWFEEYKDKYAMGIPAEQSGDVSYKGFVLGAGLVTRKLLFLEAFDDRYPSLLNGRNGSQLSTGDDFEYCKRLLLWNYRLAYDEEMRLRHFIPKERLTESYRTRLMEGIMEAGKILELYDQALQVRKKLKNKSKVRLLLMAPLRILFSRLGISSRQLSEEQLKFFYLLPTGRVAKDNKAMIKKFALRK